MIQDDLLIKHLYSRAGFGMDLTTWQALEGKSLNKAVKKLMKAAGETTSLSVGNMEAISWSEIQMMDKDSKQAMRAQSRQYIRDLNIAWFRRMAHTQAQLREKMTLFWHNHFACRVQRYPMVEQQHNTFRELGMGKFRDLLLAIAQDPAMLSFLNNQQNRKKAPNENFARELLELFTLGRGHYTEQDIKEAARAFTGWGFNADMEFVFRQRQHDVGPKTFMGEQGNFSGEDIIDIILSQKQCARFLTQKFYTFFVNSQIDEQVVDQWANDFYTSEYDIGKLLQTIFTSSHFYESQHIGTRIKSPTEFLVGIMRHLNLDFVKEEGFIYLQRVLGQVLFQPPNVAGWPGGRNWIDSSTLMARMRIPKVLINSEGLQIAARENFAGNEEVVSMNNSPKNRLATQIQWESLEEALASKADFQESVEWCKTYLFSGATPQIDLKELQKFSWGKSPKEKIKWMLIRLMSTPEYQFC